MVCPRCNQPVEPNAAFCGNCGNQIAPIQARGATVADATEFIPPEQRQYNTVDERYMSPAPNYQSPPQAYNSLASMSQRRTMPPFPQAASSTPPPVPTPLPGRRIQPNHKRLTFFAVIIALFVIGLSAGVFTFLQGRTAPKVGNPVPTAAAASTTGTASFSSSTGSRDLTDTVKIDLTGLLPLAQGMQYDAWLVNERQEQTTPLGKLNPQGQDFMLTFTDKGQNLLALGNVLLITQEQGNVSLPTGKKLLDAQFPSMAFIHIKHLLVAFPTTPHHIGLLVGLLQQARQASAQGILLQSVSNNGDTVSVSCAAQSLLNIIEGQHGQHYAVLAPQCATLNAVVNGDGFGLLGQKDGYIAVAAQHASLAAQSDDATSTVKIHAGHVEIALTNIKGWMTTIDQDAQSLLTNPGDKEKIQEIVTLTERSVNGIDLDNDEHVDPVPGEAGSLTAFLHGQLMAQLVLQKM